MTACDELKRMDKIIEDSKIVGDTTVYHGMGNTEAALFDGIDIGTEFENKAFYSTSLDQGTAESFSTGRKILVINLPHGSSGFVYGDTAYEQEVVLPRNQKFKVDKVDGDEYQTFYHVSLVK